MWDIEGNWDIEKGWIWVDCFHVAERVCVRRDAVLRNGMSLKSGRSSSLRMERRVQLREVLPECAIQDPAHHPSHYPLPGKEGQEQWILKYSGQLPITNGQGLRPQLFSRWRDKTRSGTPHLRVQHLQ